MKKNKRNDDTPIKDVVIDVLKYDIWLKILTSASLGLIIGGFICPPLAIIDGSVLIATGELTGMGALFTFAHAINRGIDAKIKIKDIELQIDNDELKSKELECKEKINNEDEQ